MFDLYRIYLHGKPTTLVAGDDMMYFPTDGTIAFHRDTERLEFGQGNTTVDKMLIGRGLDGRQVALLIGATHGLDVRELPPVPPRIVRYQFI